MSVVVRFAPASLTAEQYDKSVRRLEGSGDSPEVFEAHNIVRR